MNEWLVSSPLCSGIVRAATAVFTLRGYATRNHDDRIGLFPDLSCVKGRGLLLRTIGNRYDRRSVRLRDQIPALKSMQNRFNVIQEVNRAKVSFAGPKPLDSGRLQALRDRSAALAKLCREKLERRKPRVKCSRIILGTIARCTVERVMRDIGIEGVRRSKKVKTTHAQG